MIQVLEKACTSEELCDLVLINHALAFEDCNHRVLVNSVKTKAVGALGGSPLNGCNLVTSTTCRRRAVGQNTCRMGCTSQREVGFCFSMTSGLTLDDVMLHLPQILFVT